MAQEIHLKRRMGDKHQSASPASSHVRREAVVPLPRTDSTDAVTSRRKLRSFLIRHTRILVITGLVLLMLSLVVIYRRQGFSHRDKHRGPGGEHLAVITPTSPSPVKNELLETLLGQQRRLVSALQKLESTGLMNMTLRQQRHTLEGMSTEMRDRQERLSRQLAENIETYKSASGPLADALVAEQNVLSMIMSALLEQRKVLMQQASEAHNHVLDGRGDVVVNTNPIADTLPFEIRLMRDIEDLIANTTTS